MCNCSISRKAVVAGCTQCNPHDRNCPKFGRTACEACLSRAQPEDFCQAPMLNHTTRLPVRSGELSPGNGKERNRNRRTTPRLHSQTANISGDHSLERTPMSSHCVLDSALSVSSSNSKSSIGGNFQDGERLTGSGTSSECMGDMLSPSGPSSLRQAQASVKFESKGHTKSSLAQDTGVVSSQARHNDMLASEDNTDNLLDKNSYDLGSKLLKRRADTSASRGDSHIIMLPSVAGSSRRRTHTHPQRGGPELQRASTGNSASQSTQSIDYRASQRGWSFSSSEDDQSVSYTLSNEPQSTDRALVDSIDSISQHARNSPIRLSQTPNTLNSRTNVPRHMPTKHQKYLIDLLRKQLPVTLAVNPQKIRIGSPECPSSIESHLNDGPREISQLSKCTVPNATVSSEANIFGLGDIYYSSIDQSIADLQEKFTPVIVRTLGGLSQQSDCVGRYFVFPDLRRTAAVLKCQSVLVARQSLKAPLQEGALGLSISILPVWLSSAATLVPVEFFANSNTGDFAAVVGIGPRRTRQVDTRTTDDGESSTYQSQPIGSHDGTSPKPIWSFKSLFDKLSNRRVNDIATTPTDTAVSRETARIKSCQLEALSRMHVLPRQLRLLIHLQAMGIKYVPTSHVSKSRASKREVTAIDKEEEMCSTPQENARPLPDAFLKMTAAEKRAFYARPALNRIGTCATSPLSFDSKEPAQSPMLMRHDDDFLTLRPMGIYQFKKYCASAKPVGGHTCLWLQLFQEPEPEWHGMQSPDLARGEEKDVDTYGSVIGEGVFNPFTRTVTLLQAWTDAMMKLPPFINGVHIEACAPPGIDLAEIRMVCNRLMTLAMFRTRGAAERLAVTWEIGTVRAR